MYITKETKWHPLCCCHDNSYAAGPVLIKTNINRFYLKQGSSTPNNLMGTLNIKYSPSETTLCPIITFITQVWTIQSLMNIPQFVYVICQTGGPYWENCALDLEYGPRLQADGQTQDSNNVFISFFMVLLWKQLLCWILSQAVQFKFWHACAFDISGTKSDTFCLESIICVWLCVECSHFTLF